MSLNRQSFLASSLGAAGALATGGIGLPLAAEAQATIGNFPAGAQGSSIFVGLCCPLTGSYSADGEDQRKGYELAIEDLNNNTGVMAKIPSLRGKKGLLGKHITYKVADTETNANTATQRANEFIAKNKAIMFAGGVSTAETIAMQGVGQQQKVLFMDGASGSNDTTGKDCQRYGFRSQCDAYMVAKAMAPILAGKLGKNRRAIMLVPNYSYGLTLASSMREFCQKEGWTVLPDVVAPFPSPGDFSSYLTNIANSNADTFINIEFGNDGIASTKQAAQFGILKKMQLVVPNISTYLADGVGADIMNGVYGTLEWYWRLQDHFPLSKDFIAAFDRKYSTRPRWTAHISYAQLAIWADAVTRTNSFNPVDIIKYLEAGHPIELMLGKVHYRAEDHQQVRPVPVVLGKPKSKMQAGDDFFDIVAIVPGESVMQPLDTTNCKLPGYT
jgi:branched-chain amino acid transport system substrate-binding protein